MSHIVQAKTQIQFPPLAENPAQHHSAKALLAQAVQLVADQQAGGQITNYHLDWHWHKQPTELALLSDRLRRGMAIVVDPATGALSFVGDFWGVEELAQHLQSQIVQMYVTLSLQQVLEAQGYITQAEEGEQQGQIVVSGVTYA